MPPSRPKRRRGGASSSRGRKKQKRLDAIRDVAPAPPPPSPGGGDGSDAEDRRRSTRVRRAPVVLDTSPLASPGRKRPRRSGGVDSGGSSRRGSKGGTRDEAGAREIEDEEEEDDEGNVVWRSRLRDRVKGKAKLERRRRNLCFVEDEYEEDQEETRTVMVDVREGAEDEEVNEEGREINLTIDLNIEADEATGGANVSVTDQEEVQKEERMGEDVAAAEEEEGRAVGTRNDLEEGKLVDAVEDEGLQQQEKTEELELPVLGGNNGEELTGDESNEDARASNSGRIEQLHVHSEQIAEESSLPDERQMELAYPGPAEQEEELQQDKHADRVPTVVPAEDGPKERVRKSPVSDEKRGAKIVKEGRRCGLCGGGTDGRPPRIALHDSVDSENEAYEGPLPSDEPNYDIWDGFGDDPGWLGRLLGPIHDRFGIARVWVHQNCAVWSPEVCACRLSGTYVSNM